MEWKIPLVPKGQYSTIPHKLLYPAKKRGQSPMELLTIININSYPKNSPISRLAIGRSDKSAKCIEKDKKNIRDSVSKITTNLSNKNQIDRYHKNPKKAPIYDLSPTDEELHEIETEIDDIHIEEEIKDMAGSR